jgi:acetyl-CoA carboxylase biotin carboxyl carrier protein
MIDLSFLKRLIETVESSDIDTLEISRWATRIRISKSPSVVYGGNAIGTPQLSVKADANSGERARAGADQGAVEEKAPAEMAAKPAEAAELVEVMSPMVGTFYRAPAPDADPYVEVGDRVKVGQTLCILEAMKLMNELESEVNGTVQEICVENAEPVEYGQVLFRVEPS